MPFGVYISVFWVILIWVPLLQRVTLEKKPQSNQRALAPPLGTSLRPTGRLEWFVGARLLAKVVNDDVGILIQRGALGFFAGKPAPTEKRLLILICLPHSARGRTQVLRSG